MSAAEDYALGPKFMPALDLLRRSGATEIQVRYSDDETPIVWFVVAFWRVDPAGRPAVDGPTDTWETAAGHDPEEASLRLCEQVIDGGVCEHCHRPTMFLDDIGDPGTIYDQLMCQYQWDPELATFRRSCEGDDGNGDREKE